MVSCELRVSTVSGYESGKSAARSYKWILQQHGIFCEIKSSKEISFAILSEGTEGSGELKPSSLSHFHRPKQDKLPGCVAVRRILITR